MLKKLYQLLLVSCLSISSLYAPPEQPRRYSASHMCVGVAKLKMMGSTKRARAKHRFTSPAPGSVERRKIRKAIKKLQIRVEEIAATI